MKFDTFDFSAESTTRRAVFRRQGIWVGINFNSKRFLGSSKGSRLE